MINILLYVLQHYCNWLTKKKIISYLSEIQIELDVVYFI